MRDFLSLDGIHEEGMKPGKNELGLYAWLLGFWADIINQIGLSIQPSIILVPNLIISVFEFPNRNEDHLWGMVFDQHVRQDPIL